jgi:uncharacterized protein
VSGECGELEWGSDSLSGATMDLLTPKITDIAAEGLSLSGDVTGEELGITDADVVLCGILAIGLDLQAVERTICVTGVVEGMAVRQCVRCLKDFNDPVAFSIRVAYEREAKAVVPTVKREALWKKKAAPMVDVKPEEPNDDLYYYSGDHLELAPMLREQLILASPMHPLCAEDCRGLCAHCGKDLNEGPCGCAVGSAESPFHILRRMKEKIQESADR